MQSFYSQSRYWADLDKTRILTFSLLYLVDIVWQAEHHDGPEEA